MKKNVNIVYMSEEVPFEEVPLGKMGEVPLDKMGEVPLDKMGEVPLDKMGVPYQQDHDDVDIRTDIVNDKRYWDSLLRYQKRKGNPVLYGEPTPEIVEILIRLYHANLLRLAFLHTRETINEDYSNVKGPYQFMTGLAMHNDKIYMTISEDPQEDTLYFQKIRTLIQMLKFCNINIDYEGYEAEDFFAYDIHNDMTKSGKTTLYPTDYYGITATFKGKQAESNHGLTISEWDKIGDKCYLADYPAGAAKNRKVPLDPRLFENELSVTLVNSYDYLRKRREGVGYYPFRRQDEGDPEKYSCNNGSTCVESKLFSYLRDKQGLQVLGEIQGETAYWIGNQLPPNHILTKYSYCDGTEKEYCFDTDSDKLDGLVDVFRGKLEGYIPIRDVVLSHPRRIFREIVRPFALPCPGCLKNWSNYNGNTRTAFDYNQCIVAEYVQATSRKAKAAVGPDVPDRKGGSRTRARRTRTRKTKMRQTRTRKTRNGTVKRRRNKYSHARLTR